MPIPDHYPSYPSQWSPQQRERLRADGWRPESALASSDLYARTLGEETMVELRFDDPEAKKGERMSLSLFIATGDWMALVEKEGPAREKSAWGKALLAATDDMCRGARSGSPADKMLRRWLKADCAGASLRHALAKAAERLGRDLSNELGYAIAFEDSWAMRNAEPARMWAGIRAKVPQAQDPAAAFAAIEGFFQRKTGERCVARRYPCRVATPDAPCPAAMRQLRESLALAESLGEPALASPTRPQSRL